MQQHQLDGGAGLTGKASAEAAVGSLVIQLPSTSANQMGNQVQQQHNQASSQQPSHQQAYPMSYRNHGDHQPLATGEQNWTTALACARDTNSPVYTQARTNNDMRYSCCHHQAATRDIMLKNHQQTSNRNKYWRRNGSNSNSTRATTGTNASLLSNEANDTTDPSQQHSNASITIPTNTPATTVTTTATLGSTSSGNENDNISDDSIPPPPNYHEIPGIVPSYHGRTSGPPPAYDDVVNPNAPPPSYQSLFGQVREARKSSNGLVDLLRQLFLVLIGTIGCTMIIGFLLLIPITMIFVGFFYINECRAENIPAFLVVGGFVWIIKNMLNCYNQFKKDSTVNRPPPRRGPHLSVAVAAGSTTTVPMTTTATTSNNTTAGSNQEHRQEVVSTGNHTMSTSVAIPANEQSLTASLTTQTQVTTSTTINTTGASAGTQQNPNGSSTISSSQQHSHHNHHHHHHGHVRQPQMIGLTSDKWESVLNYFLIVWFLASCIVVYRIYEPDYDNPLSLSYCNRTVYLYAFWLMTSAFIIMAIVLSCLCCLMASSLMSCSHGR